MGKHNRPQLQIKPQNSVVRNPAPLAEIGASTATILDEEVDEHDLGALETDQAELQTGTEGEGSGEEGQETSTPTETTEDAALVAEPAPRASVLTPHKRHHRSGGAPLVEVTPMLTVNRIRIGTPWYHFERGKRVTVPKDIIPFLVERGILAPGTR